MTNMNQDTNYKEHLQQGRETQQRLTRLKIEKYNNNPNLCLTCDAPINYYKRLESKFCSRSCSATHNNSLKNKKLYGFCIYCNEKLTIKQTKFCSLKCFGLYKTAKKKEEFADGIIVKDTSRHLLKKIITERDGNRCSICSMPNEWEFKKLVLILDHIDGNSDNNKFKNLRLVCPNCDSQLDTFKGRNKGNGRFSRSQRYKNKQSF